MFYLFCLCPPLFSFVVERNQIFSARFDSHRSDASPITTAAIIPVDTAKIEVQVVPATAIARIERTRPVVAFRSCSFKTLSVMFACSGQENGVAVTFACYQHTVHSVLRRPFACRVLAVVQLLYLVVAWHLPLAAPICSRSIVLRQKLRLIIHLAGFAVNAILRNPVL